MVLASKKFVAASIQQCRWLPCPSAVSSSEDGSQQFEDLPAVLAGWSEDAKQHVFGVADVQLQLDTPHIHDCSYKKALVQPDSITDVQVARIDDILLTATSSSSGSLSVLLMQLPDEPGATTADLQFIATDAAEDFGDPSTADERLLQRLPGLHKAPAASVDINTFRQSLLSVAGDGSICIVPLQQLSQPDGCEFKPASGWSGYSQGRWVDSNTFVTTGVLGGLQLWDERRGPSPVSRSHNSWGHTGCGAMDRQKGALRQLLCLDVHPSRPTLAATGATGGTVAVWDLRFQSAPLALTPPPAAAGGDVSQVTFDLYGPQSTEAVPPVLYSTLDGALCVAQDAPAAAAADGAFGGGSGWGGDGGSSSGGLVSEVLHQDQYAICSFDVEPTYGRCVLAATSDEHLLLLHMEEQSSQLMQ